MAPSTKLMRNMREFLWTLECKVAWQLMKQNI